MARSRVRATCGSACPRSEERGCASSTPGSVHGEEEIEAVTAVLRGGPLALRIGKHVREMERLVAESFGKRRGVMCNCGSSALYLAIELLGLERGRRDRHLAAHVLDRHRADGESRARTRVRRRRRPTRTRSTSRRSSATYRPRTKAILAPNLIGNCPDWDASARSPIATACA